MQLMSSSDVVFGVLQQTILQSHETTRAAESRHAFAIPREQESSAPALTSSKTRQRLSRFDLQDM